METAAAAKKSVASIICIILVQIKLRLYFLRLLINKMLIICVFVDVSGFRWCHGPTKGKQKISTG